MGTAVRWGLLVGVVLAAAVLGGCGSDSTTIITQIQTEESAGDTVMMNQGSQEFTEPTDFSFSVNGDLAANGLAWENWGAASANGVGIFAFRDYPGTRRVEVGGTVTVSGLSECNGTNYYTQATFSFESKPPFEPQAIALPTPCDGSGAGAGGGASMSDSVKPDKPAGYDGVNFHTPSNNIGCSLSSEFVNCAVVEADWTPDGQDCSTTNTRSVEFSGDPPTIRCGAELPVDPEGTELPGRELAYGASIGRGSYSCTSSEDALTCANGPHGFSVSREGFDGH